MGSNPIALSTLSVLMKLFTIQPIEVWDKLQHDKVLLANPLLGSHVDLNWPKPSNHTLEEDMFYQAYDWMRQQMAERIPDYRGNWPWWAWHTWYTRNGIPIHKPDLRSERSLYQKGEQLARIELNIPDHKVLLSCFDGWSMVLNQNFLLYSQKEYDAVDAECKCIHGIRGPLTPDQKTKMDEYHRRKKDTWHKVFDLDWMRSSPYWQGATTIQACFEELRLDEVVRVKTFTGSAKRRS